MRCHLRNSTETSNTGLMDDSTSQSVLDVLFRPSGIQTVYGYGAGSGAAACIPHGILCKRSATRALGNTCKIPQLQMWFDTGRELKVP